jgi:lipopolysaccharide biosynthesis regulator YciM
MTESVWLWPLFFLAIAIGYVLGRYEGRRRQRKRMANLSRDYVRGLNFLLNEQPDQAVETFVASLDVTEHTLETHLALGRLFRKRGELDRATRVHQHLLSAGELPVDSREDVELELACDYMTAGLFDRAEMIFQRMVERDSRHAVTAMHKLLSIFEQERDWNSALAVGERLMRRDDSVAPVLAHYCCELASRMTGEDEYNAARRTLRRALAFDPQNARASLMQGRLEMRAGNRDNALRAFKRLRRQDPVVFDEALDDLAECYDRLDREDELVDFLTRASVEQPSTAIILKLAERLRDRYGQRQASLFIAEYMKAHPSVRGLQRIVEMNLAETEGPAREHLDILQRLADRLLSEQSNYQCRKCGFEARQLHWQCPGCKQWGTVRPADEAPQPETGEARPELGSGE